MTQTGQNIYGYTDWFPSPSSTPRSVSFNETQLRTPKTEAPNSHFLDAFSTPRFNGNQTPAQSYFTESTPVDHRSGSSSHRILSPEDPEFHVNHFKANQHLPLPPVDPSRRLSSSPGPQSSRAGAVASVGKKVAQAMDHTQMQTPPPTRGSASSRRPQQLPTAGLPLQSPVSFTPLLTNNQTGTTNQANLAFGPEFMSPGPPLFADMQFSSTTFDFTGAIPTSMAALPQTKLSWDAVTNGNIMDENMMAWQPFEPMSSQDQVQLMQDVSGLQQHSQDMSFMTTNSELAPSTFPESSQSLSQHSVVDPTMLFSFTGAPTQSFNTAMTTGAMQAMDINMDQSRQPYEQQARELERERDLARKAKQQQQQQQQQHIPPQQQTHQQTWPMAPSLSATSFRSTGRPELQRSNTDSGFRRSQITTSRPPSAGAGINHIPRKSSPLKQPQQPLAGLFSIPETSRPRPRTRLIIDETGTARTLTDLSPDTDSPQNPKSQYPELWNREGSDSEPEEPIRSRPTSFILPPTRRSSKHSRNDSDQEGLQSYKIPRPLSSISLSNGHSNISPQKNDLVPDKASRRFSTSSFGGLFGEIPNPEDKEFSSFSVDHDDDNAQNALKRVVQDRLKRHEWNSQGTLRAHNQRWSQASDHAQNAMYGGHNSTFARSPTRISDHDFSTPGSDRSNSLGDEVRCVCNSADGDGQMMIQCESCTKWLHMRCVGIKNSRVPPVYVCVLCTGQTPAVRGGRIREPTRTVSMYASPLNHKSGYRP